MKILISGGTGFLGSYSAKYFLEKGYTIGIIGRNEKIGNELSALGIKFHKGDFTRVEDLEGIFDDYDYVVHSGALSSPWGKYDDFYKTNVIGTKNMVEASIKANIKKFIHISSPSIYYDYRDRVEVKEDFLPKSFANNYAKTKYEAEVLLDKYTSDIEIIKLRPRAIVGPGDTSILPRLQKVNDLKGIPLFKDGKHLVDITYVKNVSHSIDCALKATNIKSGSAYNITNGEPKELIDLLEFFFPIIGEKVKYKKVPLGLVNIIALIFEGLSKVLNKEMPLTRYTMGVLVNSFTLDISKAKRELAYEPIISLEEGLWEYANMINKK